MGGAQGGELLFMGVQFQSYKTKRVLDWVHNNMNILNTNCTVKNG